MATEQEHVTPAAPVAPVLPTRQYVISEQTVERVAVASFIVMGLALLALLFIATLQPRGRVVDVNRGQVEATANAGWTNLTTNRALDDGRVTIDIRDAMRLVVERGVTDPFTPGGE